MTQLEMVEKLREMANISFEEAKRTLERNNWDLLDSVIELEKAGRTVKATSSYTTNGACGGKETSLMPRNQSGESGFAKTCRWLLGLLKKGVTNKFEIRRSGEAILVIPVLLLIVLLFCAPYAVLILLAVGLLFRFRYAFKGEDLGRQEVNEVFDKAAGYAENIRSYVTDNKEESQKENSTTYGDKDSDN
jgi:hypothetical protein